MNHNRASLFVSTSKVFGMNSMFLLIVPTIDTCGKITVVLHLVLLDLSYRSAAASSVHPKVMVVSKLFFFFLVSRSIIS